MELFIGLLFGVVFALVYWIKRQLSYWQRRGIPHSKPTLVASISKKHVSLMFRETYNQFKGTGPFAGLYFLILKSMLILDVDLVKNILIKDFNKFQDRGLYYNLHDDPLSANIFFVNGETWKRLRTKLTPTFTSGKMKNMFPMVLKVGDHLVDVLQKQLAGLPHGKVIEVTDVISRFTADVIGTCAFGIECNSLQNEIAEFVTISQSFFHGRRHNKLIEGLIFSFPNLARKLSMRIVPDHVHNFYIQLVRDTLEHRRRTKMRRNDFMDLLIDMMEEVGPNGERIEGLTLEEVAAQVFIIFAAGFETSSTTVGFALYELARHPSVQEKLRQDINDVLANHNDVLTYECLKKLPYLEQVVNETLRMHPIVPNLIRKARERYETGDPKYYIEKGTLIIIPSIAMHYDPEFFPEPEQFKPERFTPDEVQKRPACCWLPFGEGPRNCIGLRFGRMETSVGLIYLLRNFRFSVDAQTQIPFKLPSNTYLIASENGIRLRVELV